MTQAVNLANFANSLNSSGQMDPAALSSAVPIAKGGTGATSDASARMNLGAAKGGTMSAFSFVESGTNLYIQYNGTTIFVITSTGAITSSGNVGVNGSVTATSNVTAYGSL